MAQFVPPDSAKQNAGALLAWANENDVQELDVRFVDVRGIVQHFSMPLATVDEGMFEDGFGFDGSSVRGFQAINESDLILFADLNTARIDPFFTARTLTLTCDVYDPIDRVAYPNDPRGVAKRALEYVRSTGIADTVYFGPEAEFFLLSNVRYTNGPNIAYYEVDSHEGFWNTGSAEPGLSYLNRIKEGYFPLPPLDKTQDVRAEMVRVMMECGIDIEVHHHEVGGAGQGEIDMRFDSMLDMADKLLWYKYIVKNVAQRYGLIATFMPKPIFSDNGSGMHCHQSLWKGGQPLFFDEGGYAQLSEMALHYIGGILRHAPAILAFAAPTTNSYRRLVPGYEAPVNLVYSKRNRSAAVRIPMYSKSPKAKRIEFRAPDPSCNPYLAFSAMVLAGIDGIQNKISPGDPIDVDLYEAGIETPTVPGSLGAALDALAADHEFLLKGGVFTKEYIEGYIDIKRTTEADPVSMRPHPYEFNLYLDI
jgi:glutamine synthetase